MNSEKVRRALQKAGRAAAIWLINMGRRLSIWRHYLLICWQQQKLRRTLRRLGSQVFNAREEGEVNPLLTEAVKDTLRKAQGLKAAKNSLYQAIADLREKMRAAWRPAPEPPAEAGTSSAEPE